jgi:hypothetical protein
VVLTMGYTLLYENTTFVESAPVQFQEDVTVVPHRSLGVSSVLNIDKAIEIILNRLYITDGKPQHRNNELTERNEKIRDLHNKGRTFDELSKIFSISPQRIYQIVNFRRN